MALGWQFAGRVWYTTHMTDLIKTARDLLPPGKGFLANDEKVEHATNYLASHGIPGGSEMRRKYRELFLNTPGADEYLSGAILFEGTYDEKGDNDKLFPESLIARGIAPGVTVDEGLDQLPGNEDETVTKGLIGLPDVLHEYKAKGAVFTKWRAAIKIDGDQLPTSQAIHENARRLAVYAKDVQASGLVPVLEVEILLPGKHSRARAKAVSMETLGATFAIVKEHAVDPAALILKTSMVLSGSESGRKDTPEEVAEDTIAALMASVPAQIAGVVFLSGGQDPEEATENLAAITKRAKEVNAPWPLTFSFARALQEEAVATWKGKDENVDAARAAFLARLEKVGAAVR